MAHTLLENALFTTAASGTFINGNFGGTTSTVNAGVYEYHLAGFFGTLANNGTINLYACANSGGSSPRLLATLNVGSANGAGAALELKSDVLGTFNASGTAYTHIAVAGTVEAGGTWRGALAIISTMARTAPTSNGLAAVGSLYV